MVRSALVAVLLASAPAHASEQFNLACSGELTKLTLAGKAVSPYTRTLRIDLIAGRWCADACDRVDPIARIEPGRLVLTDVSRDTPREHWVERESVDRVTGAHSSMASGNPMSPNPASAFSEGKCEKAPFTGFTKGVRKF